MSYSLTCTLQAPSVFRTTREKRSEDQRVRGQRANSQTEGCIVDREVKDTCGFQHVSVGQILALHPQTFGHHRWVASGVLELFFILTQVFCSLCLYHKTNTTLSAYTPGRCVQYGTGSRESGPSPTTSPGRRNTACRHSSLHCQEWGGHGWKLGLRGEDVVRCLPWGWDLRKHLVKT